MTVPQGMGGLGSYDFVTHQDQAAQAILPVVGYATGDTLVAQFDQNLLVPNIITAGVVTVNGTTATLTLSADEVNNIKDAKFSIIAAGTKTIGQGKVIFTPKPNASVEAQIDADLAPVALSGNYNDLNNRPAVFSIKNAALDAGHRLRATTAGNQSGTNPQVSVGTLVASSVASAISSPTRRSAWSGQVNPNIRVLRGRATQASPNNWLQTDTSTITYAPGARDITQIQYDTCYGGTMIDLILFNSGSGAQRILVDGVLVTTVTSAQMTAAGVTSGGFGRLPLVFSDARQRVITVQHLMADGKFVGYDTETSINIAYPVTSSKGPRVLIVGDSFTEGTGVTSGGFGFTDWVSWHMGWADLWRSGAGSTGYLEPGTRTALVDRYNNDIIAQNPDIVIIAMGINDNTKYLNNPSSVTTAATTVWDAVSAGLPKAQLIIVGPWPNSGGVGVSPSLVQMDSDLHALAISRKLRYISPISEGWTFTIISDGTHPDNSGHEVLGYRLAGHLSVPYLESA